MSGRASGHPAQLQDIVAANVVAAMDALGIKTAAELARRLDTHEKTVRRWRQGEVIPNHKTLHRLADMIGVQASWFYVDHEREAA